MKSCSFFIWMFWCPTEKASKIKHFKKAQGTFLSHYSCQHNVPEERVSIHQVSVRLGHQIWPDWCLISARPWVTRVNLINWSPLRWSGLAMLPHLGFPDTLSRSWCLNVGIQRSLWISGPWKFPVTGSGQGDSWTCWWHNPYLQLKDFSCISDGDHRTETLTALESVFSKESVHTPTPTYPHKIPGTCECHSKRQKMRLSYGSWLS